MGEYVTWQDLLDEETAIAPSGGEAPPPPPPLDPEIAALMAQRDALEHNLLQMLGKAPKSPEDQRRDRLFPMPVHTRESRIEDRKRQRAEERARELAQRALERAAVDEREAVRRADARRLAEARAIEARALHEAARQRTLERRHDAERRALEEATVRQRWEAQRTDAIRARSAQGALADRRLAVRDEERRQRSIENVAARRNEERAIESRLDRRRAVGEDY